LLLVVAIAANGSRSSWIGVSAGFLTVLVLAGSSGSEQLRLRRLVLLVAFAAAVVVLTPSALRTPLAKRAATLTRLDRDKPYLARRLMVEKSSRLFREHPFFGVGWERFRLTRARMMIPPELLHEPPQDLQRKSSHNAYLALLAETGMAGTLPFGILFSTLAVTGFRATRRHLRRGCDWALPVYAGFVSMSVHFWAVAGLTNTATWFLYGLVAAVIHLDREQSRRLHARPCRFARAPIRDTL
jgi:O-antigen ligase